MTEPDEDAIVRNGPSPALEAPPEDALEQATPIDPTELPVEVRIGPEVPEADALDQAAVVELDEDEPQ